MTDTRTHTHTRVPLQPLPPHWLCAEFLSESPRPLLLLVREHCSRGHTLASGAQLSQARVSPSGPVQWMLVRLFLSSPCGSAWQCALLAISCLHIPSSFKWQLDLPVPRLRTDLKATFSPGFAWEGGGRGEVSGLGSWWSRGKWGKSSEGGVPPPWGEEASWGSMRSRATHHSPPPQGYREVRLTMGSWWSWTTERRGFQSILSEPVPLHRVGSNRVFACRGHRGLGSGHCDNHTSHFTQ